MARVVPLLVALLCGGIVFLAILALVLWWLMRRPAETVETPQAQPDAEPRPPEVETRTPPAAVAAAPAEPEPEAVLAEADDLKVIEGIGPKIASIFQAAGIITYAQLAARQPQELKAILMEAGLRLGDPATWPEQAALAAKGQWEDLEALQGSLRGGRRA
jgi:predicted flap endonuclease-1-like 5' DNA nuclease